MMTKRAKFKLRASSMRPQWRYHVIACAYIIIALASLQMMTTLAARHARRPLINADDAIRIAPQPEVAAADPMEPCYLANNRASETLTISESTPMGTIVGELMVSKVSGWSSLVASFHTSGVRLYSRSNDCAQMTQ